MSAIGREKENTDTEPEATVESVIEEIQQTLSELDEVEAMYRELHGLGPDADVPIGEAP